MANCSTDREPLTGLRNVLERSHSDVLRDMVAAITQDARLMRFAAHISGSERGNRESGRLPPAQGTVCSGLRSADSKAG